MTIVAVLFLRSAASTGGDDQSIRTANQPIERIGFLSVAPVLLLLLVRPLGAGSFSRSYELRPFTLLLRPTLANSNRSTPGASTCSITIAAAPVMPARSLRRALHDLEPAGGEGGGAAIGHLPDAGEELFVRLGDVTSHDDEGRVEEVNRGGQHLPDEPPGCPDRGDGLVDCRP